MSKHIITSAWWFGLIFLALCSVNSAAAQVDQQRAADFFKEAATICQNESGRACSFPYLARWQRIAAITAFSAYEMRSKCSSPSM